MTDLTNTTLKEALYLLNKRNKFWIWRNDYNTRTDALTWDEAWKWARNNGYLHRQVDNIDWMFNSVGQVITSILIK